MAVQIQLRQTVRYSQWLLVLVALLVGWGIPALAAEDIILQLKGMHRFQYAGYYAAIEQGYYSEADLNVEFTMIAAEDEVEKAILEGDADIGISTSELVLVRAMGKPVVALAPIFQHSPYVFLVTQDSGITNIHDLKGKRVVHEKTASDLIAYLNNEGVAFEDITLLPPTSDLSVLLDGSADAIAAYITDEPYFLEQRGIKFLTFTPRASGIDFYGDTLFTSENYLRSHQLQVDAFLAATMRGWQYALENQEELVELIISKYGSEAPPARLLFEAAETERLIMPDVVQIGYSNPGRWSSIVETYHTLGMLDPGFKFKGFLYQPGAPPDLTWAIQLLLLAAVIIVIISIIAYYFYRLHKIVKLQAQKLAKAIAETKVLRGLLPVCAHCKKIRDDEGFWQNVDTYIRENTDASFTHGICPECLHKHYPDVADQVLEDMRKEAEAAAGKS